ncbi:hypothetical protein KJ866_01655 [Patescibacteria group bacterium]|nr:hypothetical protein [Patescibacteria group bacterium]
MKTISNHYNLYAIVYELIERIGQNIKEFEYVIDRSSFKKNLPSIKTAYMNFIILDLAKLISATKGDKTGLRQLKNISPKEYKAKIEKLEKDYRDVFKKITNNRNRIIAHIDISDKKAYYNMGFSEEEINRIIDDYRASPYCDKSLTDENDPFIISIKKIQAKTKDDERYSLSDFRSNLPDFKKIISEISSINKNIISYYCKKN